MNYGFNVKMNTPDLIAWAQSVNQRNDAKAKESRDNMMNLMKMAGLAGAAYKGGAGGSLGYGGMAYNKSTFNWSPEERMQLTTLGLDPNLMSKKDILDDVYGGTNIWGNDWADNDWSI